ncbi:hypothetical protein BGX21_006460 [Mortierella sp. AD011]|nr:hypothetical protein BGX20_002635 [Mortierella sp. AD010]KAF9399323.1 hypothetical protein BGX21_006460 [Mortierella sp. AD011]
MTFDSQMTVIKPNLDPYGKYGGSSLNNGFSLHPTPEPTASPLATSSIRPGPRERTSSLHEQGKIPKRVPRSGPGWMSPNRRSRSQNTVILRARPSSLPLMSSRSFSQQPQHQHRVETSSSQSIFSLPAMQQLQSRLLQIAEQQRQQQQLATPPIRPRQAFSESEIFLPPLPRQTEMIGNEDHYEGDHMTSTAPLIQESHKLISEKQSLQIERGMNLDGPVYTDIHTEVGENKNTSDTNLQMEQELEEVRRAIKEASDRYNEAAQKLRHAKEREQALMFEQDRRTHSGGANYEPESDEESLAEHPSLYSKDSSRDPSAYEQFPLFPPTDLTYQYQHIQQRQQQQSYSQQHLRPLASPVLGREFIQLHENRASPLQAKKLDLQMGERQRSVTVVPQSGDAVSGREPSLPREQRTAQPSTCQESSNATGSSSGSNNGSGRNNNIGGDAHKKAKEPLQQYLSSPRIKIKSEEGESKPNIHGSAASSKKEPEDDPDEPEQCDWYKEYKEYSIPIEIPSSETDASSEADRIGASTSQTGGAEAASRGKHSARWRPPTPVPAKVDSQYKKERHLPVLPTIGATSEYNGTDISRRPYRRVHLSEPRSGRSYIPLPRPYPPQTSSRVTLTSSLPQTPPQVPPSRTTPQRRHRHGGQRSQTRPRIRVASSSTGSLGPRFSEFLNAISAEPELQQQATDASLDMEEDIEVESESMEEDGGSEREVESEVGDEQMEDCSE